MDSAANNNSSLLPILLLILSSFVELPVALIEAFVELTLWSGRTSESSTSADNEFFLSIQIRAYCPAAPIDKEVAISSSFQLENLGARKTEVHNIQIIIDQMIITSLPWLTSPLLLYSPSHSP